MKQYKKTEPIMKALLYGQNRDLIYPAPALLARSGFCVDVISTDKLLRWHRHINNFIYAPTKKELLALVKTYSKQDYSFIASCCDDVLKAVLSSSLSLEEKIRLLPVAGHDYFSHLCSKIGLSLLLKKHNIQTPDFLIANTADEMQHFANQIGFPVFIKIDFSSGGAGVYECNTVSDLLTLNVLTYPVLVQKKIVGRLISSSALFIQKKLIFFDIAEMLVCRPNQFGPSILRRYRKLSDADGDTCKKIAALGDTLGADGFVNFTWIESAENKELFFIEADMRPNRWLEHAKYVEEDPAKKVARYFKKHDILTKENFVGQDGCDVFLTLANQLKFYEVLLNKYSCREHHAHYYPGFYIFWRVCFEVGLRFLKVLRRFGLLKKQDK